MGVMYKNLCIRRKQNMKRINETLWKDYDKVNSQIESCTAKDEGYRLLLEERDKIRNELLKFEQTVIEAKAKEAQLIAENKREMIRNYISIGTFAASTIFSVLAMYKTFYFDEKATVTSTLGRAILNGAIPKISKR